MANALVHMELNTPDLGKAKEFYSELFGWKFNDMDMGPAGVYSTFKPDSGPGGGMATMPGGNNGWLNYIGVDDIKASTEKARTLGAKIVIDCHDIPNIGSMSIMTDPTGCAIAIFQPAPGSESSGG